MSEQLQYAFGPYRLDTGRRTLLRDGRPVRLMPKDVAVLIVLVGERGEVVTRERLRALVWPDVVVEDCNLARHVATLRQALGDSADAPTYIETIPKVGYRFLAGVCAWSGDPAPQEAAPQEAAAPVVPQEAPPAVEAQAAPAPRPRWEARLATPLGAGAPRPRLAYALAGGLAVSALVGWLATGAPVQARGPIRSLAVLRAHNLTGDPRHDHLAEALTAMMASDLGHHRELALAAGAGGVDERATPARELGRALEVEGLLETAIVGADEHVRITASLVDARTERVVWAETFQGPEADFLELQDLVAAAVAEALQLPPLPSDSAEAGFPPSVHRHGGAHVAPATAAAAR